MRTDLNDQTIETQKPIDFEAGRRAFIKTLGASAVGAAVFAAAEGDMSVAQAQSVSDINIANFALNFEYLGATFYLTAVTGQGLSASDIGTNPGNVIGGSRVSFTSSVNAALAMELAIDERNHVEAVRSFLGGSAAPRPTIDIGDSFTTLAVAAGLISPGQTFSPYTSDNNFLLSAYIFEDVCVTALIGSAALIQSKSLLALLGGFLPIEGYQAGAIRTLLFAQQNAQLIDDTMAISQTRSALANSGNPSVDDIGVGTLTSPHLVPTDANALAFGRTTRQVLNIAYGQANAAGGLFFPNGLNGVIR